MVTLGTFVETEHDATEPVVGQGPLDIVHDQDLLVSEARLAVDVGLPRGFGASLMLPIRMVRSQIAYRDLAGDEVMIENAGIHHRDETLTGLGDPMLLGTYGQKLGPVRVVGKLGVTLPLGRTEDNPFTAEALTRPHQHVQMGTGTFNPVLAAEVTWARDGWTAGAFALTQQVVYENSRGYQAGDRYALGLALRRQLGAVWSVRGGLETQIERAERWDGEIQMDDGNRGRVDAMVAAGASWAATKALSLELGLKIPFVTHAVGGQLDMPAILELGASWSFGAGPRPPASAGHDDHDHGDEHGHEHGDEHGDEHGSDTPADKPTDEHGDDHTHDATPPGDTVPADTTKPVTKPVTKPAPPRPKADIVDLAPSGAAVPLVPVKGKLTIFDLWAPWCGPCKTLDPALAALAKRHPHVALRKLDVVDWDSEAAAKYLTPGGFDLPHVKIFDANGKLIFEQTPKAGQLPAYIRAIEQLVEAHAPKR